MFKTLLLAYDGSATANHALDIAVDLAQKNQATLHVLSVVVQPDIFTEGVDWVALMSVARAQCEETLNGVSDRLKAASVEGQFDIREGHPSDQIIAYIEEKHIDLAIMGHKGRSLMSRLLVGSTARYVLEHARCPVLITR